MAKKVAKKKGAKKKSLNLGSILVLSASCRGRGQKKKEELGGGWGGGGGGRVGGGGRGGGVWWGVLHTKRGGGGCGDLFFQKSSPRRNQEMRSRKRDSNRVVKGGIRARGMPIAKDPNRAGEKFNSKKLVATNVQIKGGRKEGVLKHGASYFRKNNKEIVGGRRASVKGSRRLWGK